MELIECGKQNIVWYQVLKGDTLDMILTKFSNKSKVVRNNPNIDLYEGEMIKIEINNNTNHIVKPMETLTKIANKYDKNIEDLIKLNNLKTTKLFIGQILKIPDFNKTYTIVPGDTLYSIAKKYNTTVDKIKKDSRIPKIDYPLFSVLNVLNYEHKHFLD